ncbi:MAG: hypothetical protein ACI35W_01725 [Anaeroplasmataceae bacterium]
MSENNLTVEQVKALALIEKYEDDIESFNIQKSRLGIFQGKRKKEIEAKVADLQNKIAGLKILYHLK